MGQKPSRPRERRDLHFDALVQWLRDRFSLIPDWRRCPLYPLVDAIMAGLALFSLKDPSLLAFCGRAIDHNLRSVFGLRAVPSDTQVREILDQVDPAAIRPAFKDVFRRLQRGKALEPFTYIDHYYLVALDGVEHFRSKKVSCEHCLKCNHKDGSVSHYHQMIGAAVVHPDFAEVIPLAPEAILVQDGTKKNDCERNAARRWLAAFRRDHPRLPVIILEDALSPNAPHIRDLKRHDAHFILGVKEGDHKHLFEQFSQGVESGLVSSVCEEGPGGASRTWMYVNKLSLNGGNKDVIVNLLVYVEREAGGAIHTWAWVTDLTLTAGNVERVARAGRARWKIENETFNTLKNQGYHFEHNFGHGSENLATVLAHLMMLAFLVDQVQQLCSPVFRQAWEKKGSKRALWEAVRQLFASFEVSSMAEVYRAIAFGFKRPALKTLTFPARGGGDSS